MRLSRQIAEAVRICLFDRKAIRRIASDAYASNLAFILAFLSILLNSFFNQIEFGEIKLKFVGSFWYYLIMISIITISIHLVTKIFESKSKFISFFRPYGFVFLLDILFVLGEPTFKLIGVESIVSWFSTIWFIVLLFLIIREVYNFSTKKTLVFLVVYALIFLGSIFVIAIISTLVFPQFVESIRMAAVSR